MQHVPDSSSPSCSAKPMQIAQCMKLCFPAIERQWSKRAWRHRTRDLSLARRLPELLPTQTHSGSYFSAQSVDWQLVVLSPFYGMASTGGSAKPHSSRWQLVSQYSGCCQKCPGGAEYNRRTTP